MHGAIPRASLRSLWFGIAPAAASGVLIVFALVVMLIAERVTGFSKQFR